MKGKKLIIGSIIATTILTTSMTTNIFAQSVENNIYLEQNQVTANSRGAGGAIAGGIIGAASGTLTGVVGDIISGDDVTLGSVVVDFVGGAVSGAIQGSKLPF